MRPGHVLPVRPGAERVSGPGGRGRPGGRGTHAGGEVGRRPRPGLGDLRRAVRSLASGVAAAYRAVDRAHDAVLVQRWRSGVARERRRREDELLAVLFLDSVGVENPASYYAMEAYPQLLEQLHRWHRARGEDRLGDGMGCC